jgi:rubredoxin-NAD+ reductase
MTLQKPIIIIGTGLSGYTLAREIRKRAPEQALHIVTADDGHSYSKPMLSNALNKDKSPDALVIASAEKMAEDLNATIWTHVRVTAIHPDSRSIDTERGSLEYDRLVLALGADTIQLPIEGDAADAILSVNDLVDYRNFRNRIENPGAVAIIGAGLIGCEFANDLRNADIEVHVIDISERPLGRLLPEKAASALQKNLEQIGVHWHLANSVVRVDHDGGQFRVALKSGDTLTVGTLLSAIGLRPRIQLAGDAGLQTNRGILVDRHLRTSDPYIYALGDCAEVEDLVLPFVMPLMAAARALAAILTGEEIMLSYAAMPVVVKTPACPVVVCPPPRPVDGHWIETESETGVRAEYRDASGNLLGFALTGDAIIEKMALAKQISAWL